MSETWLPVDEHTPRDGTLILGLWYLAGEFYPPHVVKYGEGAEYDEAGTAHYTTGWWDDYGKPFSEPQFYQLLTPNPAAPSATDA